MVSIPGEILPQEKRRYAQIATNIAGGNLLNTLSSTPRFILLGLGGLSGAIVGGGKYI